MQSYEIRKLDTEEIPKQLFEIPEPPKQIFIAGNMAPEENIMLAVVGSRKYTSYGKEACEKLIAGLKGYPITIVSGLALGIDSIAHEAAMRAGLHNIAVPGSGISEQAIYPATNLNLAERIVESGGCLFSEFDPDFRATTWSFPKRNRIMAGLCKGVLIVEAEEKSGTLITAQLALDYNRDVFAVPGSIFSENASGVNRLIRNGATPIASSEQLLDALGLQVEEKENTANENLTDEQKKILEFLREPCGRDALIRKIGRSTAEATALISMMEIEGLITEEMGEIRKK